MAKLAFLCAALGVAAAIGCSSSDSGGGDDDSGSAGSGGTGVMCSKPLCGGACCGDDETCFTFAGSQPACAPKCEWGRDCTNDASCCLMLETGGGVCTPPSPYALCLCGNALDCPTGNSCAPRTDGTDPIGPNVCMPNDGLPYHGCKNDGSCSGGGCCATWDTGTFCARPCADDSQCGSATCYPEVLGAKQCGSFCDYDMSLKP